MQEVEVSEPPAVTAAIVVAPHVDEQRRMRQLVRDLTELGIAVSVVDTPAEAIARIDVSGEPRVQCVLLDASRAAAGGQAAIALIVEQIEQLAGVPPVAIVGMATAPSARLVIRAFRAGAGDFIDLATERAPEVIRVLERVNARHHAELEQKNRVKGMRIVLNDFLKGLVQSERRSIDLEHKLAMQGDGTVRELASYLDSNREPTVFIVEDDHEVANRLVDELEQVDHEVANRLVDELEQVDVTTYAFVSGEEAVRSAALMAARGEAIDLALVDARLPGMSGLEAIRKLRESRPNLGAMLMTGYSDQQTAISAADMGVIGYVLKPFDDVPALIKRIKEQAVHSMINAREYHYLQQIKQRHEKALRRYRQLAPELDRLL